MHVMPNAVMLSVIILNAVAPLDLDTLSESKKCSKRGWQRRLFAVSPRTSTANPF
jgi:hypothetical protein